MRADELASRASESCLEIRFWRVWAFKNHKSDVRIVWLRIFYAEERRKKKEKSRESIASSALASSQTERETAFA